jgi:hypothetical protein
MQHHDASCECSPQREGFRLGIGLASACRIGPPVTYWFQSRDGGPLVKPGLVTENYLAAPRQVYPYCELTSTAVAAIERGNKAAPILPMRKVQRGPVHMMSVCLSTQGASLNMSVCLSGGLAICLHIAVCLHLWNKDPMCGCQLGTNCPILHAK